MKRVILFAILTSLIIGGCKSSSIVEPVPEPYNLKDQLQKVNFTQIDYSTVLIESRDSMLIRASDFLSGTITQIIAGYNIEDFSVPVDTITPQYAGNNNDMYTLEFSDSLVLPALLYNTTVWVKYFLSNGDSVTTSKDFFLLYYPYLSTSLILPYNYYISFWIQDFAYRKPLLYYHPYGAEGLYSMNINTHQIRLLYDYYGGSFIDANSDYVFVDVNTYIIKRYDIEKDTITKELDLKALLGNQAFNAGMTVHDSLLYVYTTFPYKMVTLNEDLDVISIRDFQDQYGLYSLAYYRGFLYSIDYANVVKINEANLEVVDRKKSPVEYMGSVKVYEDKLFFTDDRRYILCSTQLDEIFK